MYCVYVNDRCGVFWLRRWIVTKGGHYHPVLSSKRDHATRYKRFDDALRDLNRLKETPCDAHIEAGRKLRKMKL